MAVAPAAANAQVPTFEAATDLVHVWVSVRDGDGKVARGLPQEAFTLQEEGKERPIVLFGFSSDSDELGRVATLLLLDTSARMALDIDKAREAALGFIDKMPTTFALYNDTRVDSGAAAAQAASTREWLEQATVGGASAFCAGIVQATARLRPSPQRRVVVALTDGFDQVSPHRCHEAAQRMQTLGVTFYALQFRARLDARPMVEQASARMRLNELADATGGLVLTARGSAPDMLDAVIDDLTTQYVLGFAPGGGSGVRRLRVRVDRKGLKARHRPAYWADGR